MSNFRRSFYALLAASLLVAAMPVAALAQTDREPPARDDPTVSDERRGDSFERAKAHVIKQIERRLDALDRLTRKIEAARYVTEDHAASLLRDIAAARETLRAGLAAVQATTTPEALREIAPPIFHATLVFALLGPKTHEVIASDAVVAASVRFTDFGTKLQETLDRIANETDIDTTEAQADLDEMIRLGNAAAAIGGPVAGNVIDLQPDNWPDPAQAALREGKAALSDARLSLREARGLAKAVVQFIRSVKNRIDG
jgi:hypothetical protein